MHQLLTPLGIDDISFADILTAAMAEYERQLHQRIELEKHQDIKRTLERLGYEKKQTSSSHTRQPFLSRPIRALRQWWHDLKQSTVPVERLETVGMNSTSMGCDGCHTQVK